MLGQHRQMPSTISSSVALQLRPCFIGQSILMQPPQISTLVVALDPFAQYGFRRMPKAKASCLKFNFFKAPVDFSTKIRMKCAIFNILCKRGRTATYFGDLNSKKLEWLQSTFNKGWAVACFGALKSKKLEWQQSLFLYSLRFPPPYLNCS